MSTATATKPEKKTAAATGDAVDYKISEAASSLGSIYAKSVSIEKDGTVTIDGDIVHDNLPPDHSLQSIKAHQKLRAEVIAGLTVALGEKGLPILAKNKDLERVTLTTKFGNDKIDLSLERQREFGDGNGGKVIKHGHVNLGYTASGATNAGDFKKVRAKIGDEAKLLFG